MPLVRVLGADSEGIELCRRGLAEDAIAWYKTHGVMSHADGDALFELTETLIVNGEYDRAEWYVVEADRLLGGGTLRNNLAWHYTQTYQRQQKALDLALASVADRREACNVDTLAWAYYVNGDLDVARSVARETLTFGTSWLSGFCAWQESEARLSSERLLRLIDITTAEIPTTLSIVEKLLAP